MDRKRFDGFQFGLMENKKKISLNYIALPADQGQRVDQITAKQFPDYSRAHIQRWIKDGDLLVNSKEVKSKYIMPVSYTHLTLPTNREV